MKKVILYLFICLYVLFELVTWLFFTPATLFDGFAALAGPALALWIIFWTNIKTGQGLVGMFQRGKSKTTVAPKDI